MQLQCACVGGGLQPGTVLVVVCLAVVTLQPRSTTPTVAGCRLVGCSVVSRLPLRSRTVGVSLHAWVQFWAPMPRPRLLLLLPPGEGGVGFP